MVETKEREVVYTTDQDAGPSTALVILFSLLIIAVLGFMIYYFSNNNLNNQPSIIERNTNTTTTIPVPTPSAPSVNVPAPTNINVTPPSTGGATTDNGTPSSAPTGNPTTP